MNLDSASVDGCVQPRPRLRYSGFEYLRWFGSNPFAASTVSPVHASTERCYSPEVAPGLRRRRRAPKVSFSVSLCLPPRSW
ncbi:unnamed protein product [Victoria cruziana]